MSLENHPITVLLLLLLQCPGLVRNSTVRGTQTFLLELGCAISDIYHYQSFSDMDLPFKFCFQCA